MKNICLSITLLFAVLLSVNFVSASAAIGHQFQQSVYGLPLSSGLTLQKVMDLCTQENCKINTQEKTITILSHYDNRVALIISGDLSNSQITMTTKIPYDINTTAVDNCNEGLGCDNYFILHGINPEEYNWGESNRVDLSYLSEIGVLNLQSQEITAISNLGGNALKCGDIWQIRPTCPTGCDGKGPCEGPVMTSEPFPILPSTEFTISSNFVKKQSSNLIYWIIGIAGVVVVIILVLVLMRKKK